VCPRGQATILASHEDFWSPGRPRHAVHPEHSPTPDVSSGSIVGSRPCLAALARSTRLQRRSMGLSFGTAVVPTTSLVRPVVLLLSSLFLIFPSG
jgi:hypothetical protein